MSLPDIFEYTIRSNQKARELLEAVLRVFEYPEMYPDSTKETLKREIEAYLKEAMK